MPGASAATSSRHDRAGLRHFQAAEFARDGAGEGAALVAEKFGFDQFGRQAGAINFQERSVVARAVLVNPARELIFAGAAFAGDQHGGGGVGDFVGKFEDVLRRGIRATQGMVRRRS